MIFRGIGLSLLLAAPLAANTGVFLGVGGRMVAIRNSQVRMVKEQVDIRLVADPGRYSMPCMPVAEVRAEFLLQNTSRKAVTLQAGFPFALPTQGRSAPEDGILKLLAFAVESEGQRRPTMLRPGKRDPRVDPKGSFSHVYVWSECFRAGESRRVVVTYRQMLSFGKLMADAEMTLARDMGDLASLSRPLEGLQAHFFYVTATAQTWKQGPDEARFTLDDRSMLEGFSRPIPMGSLSMGKPLRMLACSPAGARMEGPIRVWTFRNGVPAEGISLHYLRVDWPTTPQEFQTFKTHWTEKVPSYLRVKGIGTERLAPLLAAGFRRLAGQHGQESPWVERLLQASWMVPGAGWTFEPLDPEDRKVWLEAAKMLDTQ